VIDRSPRQPIARHYSSQATTGRGLGLVKAVSNRWGVRPDGDGKTVWAELVAERASLKRVPDLADADGPPWAKTGDDIAEHGFGAGPAERPAGLRRGRAA